MKETLKKLLLTLSNNAPEITFEVRFANGETARFGGNIRVGDNPDINGELHLPDIISRRG